MYQLLFYLSVVSCYNLMISNSITQKLGYLYEQLLESLHTLHQLLNPAIRPHFARLFFHSTQQIVPQERWLHKDDPGYTIKILVTSNYFYNYLSKFSLNPVYINQKETVILFFGLELSNKYVRNNKSQINSLHLKT